MLHRSTEFYKDHDPARQELEGRESGDYRRECHEIADRLRVRSIDATWGSARQAVRKRRGRSSCTATMCRFHSAAFSG